MRFRVAVCVLVTLLVFLVIAVGSVAYAFVQLGFHKGLLDPISDEEIVNGLGDKPSARSIFIQDISGQEALLIAGRLSSLGVRVFGGCAGEFCIPRARSKISSLSVSPDLVTIFNSCSSRVTEQLPRLPCGKLAPVDMVYANGPISRAQDAECNHTVGFLSLVADPEFMGAVRSSNHSRIAIEDGLAILGSAIAIWDKVGTDWRRHFYSAIPEVDKKFLASREDEEGGSDDGLQTPSPAKESDLLRYEELYRMVVRGRRALSMPILELRRIVNYLYHNTGTHFTTHLRMLPPQVAYIPILRSLAHRDSPLTMDSHGFYVLSSYIPFLPSDKAACDNAQEALLYTESLDRFLFAGESVEQVSGHRNLPPIFSRP